MNKTYIDGKWIDGTSQNVLQSINPATGEVIARIKENSVEDVNKAILAAKKSFYLILLDIQLYRKLFFQHLQYRSNPLSRACQIKSCESIPQFTKEIAVIRCHMTFMK